MDTSSRQAACTPGGTYRTCFVVRTQVERESFERRRSGSQACASACLATSVMLVLESGRKMGWEGRTSPRCRQDVAPAAELLTVTE